MKGRLAAGSPEARHPRWPPNTPTGILIQARIPSLDPPHRHVSVCPSLRLCARVPVILCACVLVFSVCLCVESATECLCSSLRLRLCPFQCICVLQIEAVRHNARFRFRPRPVPSMRSCVGMPVPRRLVMDL